jgi:hypothetical protein
MPRQTISFDTVGKIGLALPGVEEGTTYGSPARPATSAHAHLVFEHSIVRG